jgi:O-antigen ligase
MLDWLGPVLVCLTLLVASLTGGANTAMSTQLFALAVAAILVIVFIDPKLRAAYHRLPRLNFIFLGSGLVALVLALQFTPLMICMPKPQPWARPDMVTIDPAWTLRGITGFFSAMGLLVLGAIFAADRDSRRAIIVLVGLFYLVVVVIAGTEFLISVGQTNNAAGQTSSRLNGSFVSANTMASLLIIGGITSLGYFFSEYNSNGGRARTLSAGLSFAVALCCFICLIGTQSKAGLFVAGAILSIFVMVIPRWNRGRTLFVLILVWFFMWAAVMYGDIVGFPLRQSDVNQSIFNRVPEWNGALNLFYSRPCLGWGGGTFSLALNPIKPPPMESVTLVAATPHNFFLLILSETGILGCLAWATLAYACGRLLMRANVRAEDQGPLLFSITLGLAAVLVHNLVDYSLAVPLIGGVFCLTLGFAIGLCSRPRNLDGRDQFTLIPIEEVRRSL